MKLRTDLLAKLTPEMVLKGALANQHRYNSEPLFSKTGIGSLRTASPKERAKEEKFSTALIRKLRRKSAANRKR